MVQRGTSDLIRDLADESARAVRAVIAPGSRCALLGYPNHTNPGDLAIWLAAKAILARLDVDVVYECSWRDYAPDVLADAVAGGAQIVFTGGGNFGDVWPATHALRERVLRAFPGVPIVQLPQTIHFREAEALARSRALLARHGRTVLMVRDAMSRALAARAFHDVDVRLSPDLALCCPLEPPAPATDAPVVEVLVVAREDRESRGLGRASVAPGMWRVDWNLRENERQRLDGEPPLTDEVLELIDRNRALTKRIAAGGGCWQELAHVRDALARARLARACRILRRGRVIVTDSLHAHLVGLRLGIPTVVTDNNYGKLRATFETFTDGAPLAHWADSPEQALTIARQLTSAEEPVAAREIGVPPSSR